MEGKWLQSIYHSPQDDMTQDFDFEAGARFGQVNFLVGYLVANQTERPAWTPGDFFGEKFGAARTPVPGGPTDEG